MGGVDPHNNECCNWFVHIDLQRRLHRIDDKFSEQAHELQDMKKHLYEAKTTQEQGAACSQKLEQQHRELLQQQKKILQHISKVHVHIIYFICIHVIILFSKHSLVWMCRLAMLSTFMLH